MRRALFALLSVGYAFGSAALAACTADDATAPPPRHDASTTDATLNDASARDALAESSAGDAASEADAAIDTGAGGPPVTYTVPAAGGTVSVQAATTLITFTFPASAAGKTVTLKPSTAASLGWGNELSDVVEMTPEGTTFIDPVLVTPASHRLLVMTSPNVGQKANLEPLPLASSGLGFALAHFSSLVIVDPAQSCAGSNGWQATPNDPLCAKFGGGSTTRLSYACKAHAFCTIIEGSCCVPASTTRVDCQLGDGNLYLAYERTGNDGGPYCAGDDAGARPACPSPSTITMADAGPSAGSCTATTTYLGDTYSLSCSPTADVDGGQACVCSKNGAPFSLLSGHNDCPSVSSAFAQCTFGGCAPQ